MRRLIGSLKTADRDTAVALVYTGLLLTAFEYGFLPAVVQRRVDPLRPVSLEAGVTWAAACVVGYTVLPLLLLRWVHRLPARAAGYATAGFPRHAPVYLGLFLLMLPVLLHVSQRNDFLSTYPFVAEARADTGVLWRWEVAYLAQFFALESFFRGYLLFVLERRMQGNAIFVMAVPYAMIHFHKPLPEALGALGAGLLLGTLALRYRSFWGGVLLHGLVALTMDLLAVHRAGLL